MNKKHPYEEYGQSSFRQQREDAGESPIQDRGRGDWPGAPEQEGGLNYDLGPEDQELFTVAPQANLTEDEVRAILKEKEEAEEIRLRALAEVDNMRKRMAREKEESVRYAASNVLSDILPALDNLDLALAHARNQEACKDFFVGVDMTRKLLLEALGKHGLKPVGEIGEAFDPAVHEAMGLEANPDVENGAICRLLNKGYTLHDRLLRPARVMVCKK